MVGTVGITRCMVGVEWLVAIANHIYMGLHSGGLGDGVQDLHPLWFYVGRGSLLE
jgi:hypothetical protein